MKVDLLDHMGTDLSVVNAARVSFEKFSEWEHAATDTTMNLDTGERKEHPVLMLSDRDAKLINYLAKHNHWTPFGHCFASFRIKAPIFVARQLGKHQVGLVWNEVSRRYVDSEPEFYVPETWRKRAENVKQGSSKKTISDLSWETKSPWSGFNETVSGPVDSIVRSKLQACLELYILMLNNGICPEQARMVLPQSMYTEWVWSGSLAAFARVCKLRLDPHTQYETRQIAAFIDNDLKSLFPVSWKALMNEAAD